MILIFPLRSFFSDGVMWSVQNRTRGWHREGWELFFQGLIGSLVIAWVLTLNGLARDEAEDGTEKVVFRGWARMALPLLAFNVVEVRKPRVGENKPAAVTADITLDTKRAFPLPCNNSVSNAIFTALRPCMQVCARRLLQESGSLHGVTLV